MKCLSKLNKSGLVLAGIHSIALIVCFWLVYFYNHDGDLGTDIAAMWILIIFDFLPALLTSCVNQAIQHQEQVWLSFLLIFLFGGIQWYILGWFLSDLIVHPEIFFGKRKQDSR